VSFIDCAGPRALLATRRHAELRGGCVRLIAASAAVRRTIELTTADEALAEGGEPGPFGPISLYRTDQMRHPDRSVEQEVGD
jgi:hypothetical protein